MSFDMMFLDESPKTLNDENLEALTKKAGPGGRITLADLNAVGFNNDKIFADSIASMNRVILSYTFNDEPANYDVQIRQKKEAFKKAQVRFLERSSKKLTPEELKKYAPLDDPNVKSISYPIPAMMNTARTFGFVNRDTDVDGTVRKVRLVRVHDGRLFYNLALVMLMDAYEVPVSGVEVVPGSRIILKKAVNPETKEVRDITVPIDERGMMYVTWAGSGKGRGRREDTFHQVSFYALLEYRAPAGYDDSLTVAEYVHRLFDQEDKIKAEELANLNEQLEGFNEEYRDADPAMRKNMTASIDELKKKIAALSANAFLGDLALQLDTARKEYDRTRGRRPEEEKMERDHGPEKVDEQDQAGIYHEL